eukprot:3245732-Pyramimonas_sp.AAC.3
MLPEFSQLLQSNILQSVRVLHLVRDGRDMATSEDQHESEQFKSVLWAGKKAAASRRMLQDGAQQDKMVEAMQIWSTLNTEVSECAMKLEVRNKNVLCLYLVHEPAVELPS